MMSPQEIEARRRAALILARQARQKLQQAQAVQASMRGLGDPALDSTSPPGTLPAGSRAIPSRPVETLNMSGPAFMGPDTPTLIRLPSGKVIYNKDKDYQKVFYLRALSSGDTFPVALSANGTTYCNLTVAAEEREKGDYEIVKLMATSSAGRFSAELTQPNVDRIFSNNPIPNNLIFGRTNLPGYLPESLYVPATSFVRIKLTDLNGSGTNNVRITAYGRRFMGSEDPSINDRLSAQMAGRQSHPFWLTFNDGTSVQLTSGQIKTFYMRVPSEADFECFGAVDDSDGAYTVSLFDGSFRQMMDGAVPAQDFFAAPTSAVTGFSSESRVNAASLPFTWPFTHIFKAATQLRFDLVDTSLATNNIRLALYGRLLYYPKS